MDSSRENCGPVRDCTYFSTIVILTPSVVTISVSLVVTSVKGPESQYVLDSVKYLGPRTRVNDTNIMVIDSVPVIRLSVPRS